MTAHQMARLEDLRSRTRSEAEDRELGLLLANCDHRHPDGRSAFTFAKNISASDTLCEICFTLPSVIEVYEWLWRRGKA